MNLPLANVRVVDFTHVVAGPHCTMWLASLGAEVLKIETAAHPDSMRQSQLRAQDEGTIEKSPTFVAGNLSKKSVAINIATPEGRDLCRRLIAESDVVVENFSSGIVERFGLGYEDLRQIRPDIIMASISGFGHTGAYAGFVAVGQTIQAFSGISSTTGYIGGPPEQYFMYYCDVLTGQSAVLGILAALRHRARTGEGQFIDVAMSETAISVAPAAVLHYSATGQRLAPQGNSDEAMAPHGCYPCKGVEAWLAIAVQDDSEWRALCDVLEHPEWAGDPRFARLSLRIENQAELDGLLTSETRGRDAFELAAALQANGIAAAPSQTARDLLADPQLAARDYFVDVAQNALGTAKLPRLPWRLGNIKQPPYGEAPAFDSSTENVLRDLLGLSDVEIGRLRECGALG